jgi:hypothetical protein
MGQIPMTNCHTVCPSFTPGMHDIRFIFRQFTYIFGMKNAIPNQNLANGTEHAA